MHGSERRPGQGRPVAAGLRVQLGAQQVGHPLLGAPDLAPGQVLVQLLAQVAAQVVGEAWSVFLGGGSAFSDKANPKVVVQVGKAGDTGIVEISDIIFATRAPGKSPYPDWLSNSADGLV